MWKWKDYCRLIFSKENMQHYFLKNKKLHFSNMPVKNITWVFWKTEKYYLKEAKNIWILDIIKYEWHIISRFFYWIYNIKKNKGWIRLNWISIDDFFIQIWLTEKNIYDVNIWNKKWVFSDSKNIDRWNNIRYKKRFTNNRKECEPLEKLYRILRRIWASTNLIKTIFSEYKNTYSWDRKLQFIFFDELKILNKWNNDSDKEKFMKKYKMRLNKIWKEYKKNIYLNTNKND